MVMERLLRKYVARVESPLSQIVCSGGEINAQEKQRRSTEALQDLEDERLERCKSADPFTFDQCFFFGVEGSCKREVAVLVGFARQRSRCLDGVFWQCVDQFADSIGFWGGRAVDDGAQQDNGSAVGHGGETPARAQTAS